MCGIVGAVAKRSVKNFLIEGLKKLEYRGYDSAGVAFISKTAGNSYEILRDRCLGRVSVLESSVAEKSIDGCIGIAHTRWATHGKPSVVNAHPHMSGTIAMVHNGIIENYAELKSMLIKHGYIFTSETDTEVFVHLVNYYRKQSCGLLEALQQAIKQVKGAYGTAIIDSAEPDSMVVARCGSPLVIGLGQNENFVASDQIALLSETSRFIYLKDGDTARITGDSVTIYDSDCNRVEREITVSDSKYDATDKNGFSHYMEKEIHEQPVAIRNTLDKRIANGHFIPEAFGSNAVELFGKVRHIQIVACGTSYHAGLIAKYWTEQYLNVSCSVEIASEYRYRKSYTYPDSLFVTISQSGETADTLEALRLSKKQGYMASLSICNVGTSSMVRESDLCLLTKAGTEIGVASTKAFTTQLVALLLLIGNIGVVQGTVSEEQEKSITDALQKLPVYIDNILNRDSNLSSISEYLKDFKGCIFLGRGINWPVAMEGALKLKEISYIHAEAYAGGELKHGPIALIDENMPTVIVAPSNGLLDKLRSNIESVKARKGFVYLISDEKSAVSFSASGIPENSYFVIPKVEEVIEPIVYTVPLQLIAYKVAVLKGTDVDKPRNLAKSVTVE